MPIDPHDRPSGRWRTPTAIGLAVAAGVAAGLFLHATAVPFGPILVGWFAAIAGAVVVSGTLCILATSRYVVVGLGYAMGVAASVVVASVASSENLGGWWGPPAQFTVVFAIAGCPSLLASGLCALLKWENKRARTKNQ